MTISVYALIPTLPDAGHIIEELRQRGFPRESISLLVPQRKAGDEPRAPAGGSLTQALRWLAGTTKTAIPGIGPVITSGSASTAWPSTTDQNDGFIGLLAGIGVPEEETYRIAGRVGEGDLFMAVDAVCSEDADEIKETLEAWGGIDVGIAAEHQIPVSGR